MKNLKKPFIVMSLTLLITLSFTENANAWKFWGKEVTKEIGVNELECGAGCVGVQQEVTTYRFGIPVSTETVTTCICN